MIGVNQYCWQEAKTTNGLRTTPLIFTRNELHVSEERFGVFLVVRLYNV